MKERTAEPARIFSVYLPVSLYEKVLERAGKGSLNAFIKQLLEKEVVGEREKLEQQLIKGYQTVAKNQNRQAEDEIWDETTQDGLS